MSFLVVEAFFPIIYTRAPDAFSEQGISQFFAEDEARARQHIAQNLRCVRIMDLTHAKPMNPLQRERLAQWLSKRKETMEQSTIAVVFVVPNMAIRGMLTAIMWLQKPPVPHSVQKTPQDALDWAAKQLATENLALPSALQSQGFKAFAPYLDGRM